MRGNQIWHYSEQSKIASYPRLRVNQFKRYTKDVCNLRIGFRLESFRDRAFTVTKVANICTRGLPDPSGIP